MRRLLQGRDTKSKAVEATKARDGQPKHGFNIKSTLSSGHYLGVDQRGRGGRAGGDKVKFLRRTYGLPFGGDFRAATVPAAIALAVILCAAVFAEFQNREIFMQQSRADVAADLAHMRGRLEGNLDSNIQLVRGLVATVSTEPDMSQERFSVLASRLLQESSQIRHIAAAPNFVVSLIYPVAGNEKAIGLDYRQVEGQRASAFQARDTGELALAGPIELVQGGTALVGRFPVFTGSARGQGGFWGVISAAIDTEKVFRDSGLFDPALPYDVAIGHDLQSKPFFGNAEVLLGDPVVTKVNLPSLSLFIAAVPKRGWHAAPNNVWLLRVFIFVCGALILIPILLTGRLVGERQRHIGELSRRELELEQLSRRLALALDTSKVGVWDYDTATKELVWDERMAELYGLECHGKPRTYETWKNSVHPDDVERAEREFDDGIASTGKYEAHFRIRLPDGDVRHVRAVGATYLAANGNIKVIGLNWDVSADVALNEDLRRAKNLTEARNAELLVAKARIELTALHDSLTGLPNRRYLDEKLELRALARGGKARRTALLHIDLDRFKQINDTLGHAAGDAMLIHAANVLKNNVRAGDFLARVGGDEFVVLCQLEGRSECENARYLSGIAERIIGKMRQPVMYEGHECRFGVSIGIATDDGSGDPRDLLVNADIALYRAKSLGRNRHQFFNEALQAEIINTKRVADEILTGLEQGQFVVHYQPQFDASTLEVTGVEALVRWKHPTQGILGPDSFLKIAEELSVVSTIDRLVLEQALADFEEWRAAGLAIPKLAVNVSARRLDDEELIAGLRGLGIRPGTVSFELVESIFLDDKDTFIGSNVQRIKDLGIDIEIDDFGTGYASIVSLIKLRPRRLKIDRQLVMPIVSSAEQRGLVQSIIEIGRSLGIEVIAEGVETLDHVRILKKLGCQELQGYVFARPMSSEALKSFVHGRSWRAAS